MRAFIRYSQILWLCIIFLPQVAFAAENCPIAAFHIKGVAVSAEADTGEVARQTAANQGLNDAWGRLTSRLLLPSQILPADDTIAGISDRLDFIHIDTETVLPRRYRARLDYCFDRRRVRDYFNAHSLLHAELPSQVFLVLPILNDANGPRLWHSDNWWFSAWQKALGRRDGLVDLQLPRMLATERKITGQGIMGGIAGRDKAMLAEAAVLETAGRVIVASLTPVFEGGRMTLSIKAQLFDSTGNFESTIYNFDYSNLDYDNFRGIDPDASEGIAAKMIDAIESAWRQTNVINTARRGYLTLRVPATDIQTWQKKLDGLRRAPNVDGVKQVQLSANGGIVELDMVGSIKSLNYALEQQGLVIEQAFDHHDIPLVLRLIVNGNNS